MSATSELVRAIKLGNISEFSRILESRPDLNVRDALGWTPLFYAVASGDAAMTTELLRNGADAEIKDNAGWTPLSHAQLDGRRDICNLLSIRENSH